jgi:hypothetical protein
MKTILLGAISAAGATLAQAHTSGTVGEFDSDSSVRQLESVASPLQTRASNVRMGATARTYFTKNGEFESGGDPNTSGFLLDTARLWAEGSYSSFDWRFAFGFVEGAWQGDPAGPYPTPGSGQVPLEARAVDQQFNAELLDAWARWRLSEVLGVRVGNINPADSFSGAVNPEGLVLPRRTLLGELNHAWDLGVEVEGAYGDQEQPDLTWSLAMLNGGDGAQTDNEYRARVEFNLGDEGGAPVEGALTPDGQMGSALGVFWSEDGATKASIQGIDYRAAYGNWSFIGEYAQLNSSAVDAAVDRWFFDPNQFSGPTSDADYWSATLTGLFGADGAIEGIVRYEDLGLETGDTRLTVGTNYYLAGHDVKWQLAWSQLSSDDGARDGQVIQLGLSASLSTTGR